MELLTPKEIEMICESKPQSDPAILTASRHDVVISRTEKPHSYEFGKAGARHKVFYGEVEELKIHIEALRQAGLVEGEDGELFG